MAFTQAQIDALEAAIATGTLRVTYQDRSVQYQSIDDMLKALALAKSQVTQGTGGRSTFATYKRGTET